MNKLSSPLKFQTLFKGRTDYCLFDGNRTVQKEVTQEDFENHFNGTLRLGIFPIVESEYVHFFVFDIDTNDPKIVDTITAALLLDGVIPYVEKSKSKGYHVWVFLSEKMRCPQVRYYMKSTLKKVGLSENKIDLFPRQDRVESDGVGNAINLPLFNLHNDFRTDKNRFISDEPIECQKKYVTDIQLTKASIIKSLITDFTPIISELKEEKEEVTLVDNDHEQETLRKLLNVCKKTAKLRNDSIKAEKLNRSLRDVVYAKHLGELMFSESLIKSEIKTISPKYNDPALRGIHKERYLADKVSQYKYLKSMFSYLSEITSSDLESVMFD